MSNEEPYELPNGLRVFQHNAYETDFVYREIFEEQVYFKHGITLQKNACVIDIGANIGLFALYVQQHHADAHIYSFEPSPQNCELFKLNTQTCSNITLFQQGIADSRRSATFTYYPGYSIMSGFYADNDEDKSVLGKGIAQQLQEENTVPEQDRERFVELVMANKLENPIQYPCELITLSDFIQEQNIQQIDLLKIDAEKGEVDILKGIAENHWPIIQQIVVEAHDPDTALQLNDYLQQQQYRVIQEQEKNFGDAGIFNLYAFKM